MKKAVLSAFVVAACAGSAFAQEPVRLDLRIVRQSGFVPATVTDVDANSSYTATAGEVIRFEVQYRVIDLRPFGTDGSNDDFVYAAGLSSLQMDLTSSNGGRFRRARISSAENTAGSVPPGPVDSSGTIVPPPNAQRAGLINPFRGGITTSNVNFYAANGTFTNGNGANLTDIDPSAPGDQNGNNSTEGDAILDIVPLAISQHGQGYEFGASNYQGEWYGLYAFEYVVGSNNATIGASLDTDLQTGNTFGWFADGIAVPLSSSNSNNAAYQIIVPAPGAFALLGLGGLLVSRRRRA